MKITIEDKKGKATIKMPSTMQGFFSVKDITTFIIKVLDIFFEEKVDKKFLEKNTVEDLFNNNQK